MTLTAGIPQPGAQRVERLKQDGLAGLRDRNSRPHRLRQPTAPEMVERIGGLRRQRLPGREIAATNSLWPNDASAPCPDG